MTIELSSAPTQNAGLVSIIIPARNEEANIERVTRSIAEQAYLLEIIVVDDASTDRTVEILQRIEREISLLRVVRLDSLPEGWTGKTHAAAAGASAAKGEWLLFTDADTFHLPGSLESLLDLAIKAGADLLSISPAQETPTWWESAVMPRVFVQLARWYPFEDVSSPNSSRAAANGQYLLIRRSDYQSAGGFESVRGEVLDDVAFAKRVKAQGKNILFLPGAKWVRTRMYRQFHAMREGWAKNLFPLADYNSRRLLRALGGCFADLLPAVAWGTLVCWLLARLAKAEWLSPGAVLVDVGLLAFCLASASFFASRGRNYARELAALGYDKRVAGGLTVGSALLALLLLDSWRVHRLNHRVRWKGRNYPVKQVNR